ncbi:MAG: CAP domain-containing protein [Planctomycetaceae bacterium]|nr:CAP domain-containing protein [Planctomycetaceae bacterium]
MSTGSLTRAGHRKSVLFAAVAVVATLCLSARMDGADKAKSPIRKGTAAASKVQKPVAVKERVTEEKAEPAAEAKATEEKPKIVGVVGIGVTFVAKGVVPPKKVDAAAVAVGKAAAEVKADEPAAEEEPKDDTKKPKKKKSSKAAAKASGFAKSKFGGFGGGNGGPFGTGMFGSASAGGYASAGMSGFSGFGGLPYAAGNLMNFSPQLSIASANATAVAVASGDGAGASASASAGAFAAGGSLGATDDAMNCPRETPTDTGDEPTDDTEDGTGNLPDELASVVKLTNQERTRAGLATLTVNDTLMTLAQEQSDRMANANTMSHEVNGLSFMQRITSSNYNPAYAGENIAFGQATPEEVVTAWMNSPGHRANILNPNFTEIGVGVAQGSNGALYWTQIFGQPMAGGTQSSNSGTNSGTTNAAGTSQSTDSGTTGATTKTGRTTTTQSTGN